MGGIDDEYSAAVVRYVVDRVPELGEIQFDDAVIAIEQGDTRWDMRGKAQFVLSGTTDGSLQSVTVYAVSVSNLVNEAYQGGHTLHADVVVLDDGYTLQAFAPGDTRWSYKLDKKFGNIVMGDMMYVVVGETT